MSRSIFPLLMMSFVVSATAFGQFSKSNWEQEQKHYVYGVKDYAEFGRQSAIYNNKAVVGHSRNDTYGESAGAAHIYEYEAGAWQHNSTVYASDPHAYAAFGNTMAITDNLIIVGAPNYNLGGFTTGSVYVFTKNRVGTWSQSAQLFPDKLQNYLNFGHQIAATDHVIAVSAPFEKSTHNMAGVVYIFEKVEGVWSITKKITDPIPTQDTHFGATMALSQKSSLIMDPSVPRDFTLMIGSHKDAGAVNFYTYSDGDWTLTTRQAGLEGRFLVSLDISGNDAVAAFRAPGTDTVLQTYSFGWNGWCPTGTMTNTSSGFGNVVAIDRGQIITSSLVYEDPNVIGDVYHYKKLNGAWSNASQIFPKDDNNNYFGASLGLSNGKMIIGAPWDNGLAYHGGAVYFFSQSAFEGSK